MIECPNCAGTLEKESLYSKNVRCSECYIVYWYNPDTDTLEQVKHD